MPSKCDCPVEVSELRPFSAVSVGSEALSRFCVRHRPEALTKQFKLLKFCSPHKAFLNCTRYVHHGCRSCNSQKNERNFDCLVSEMTHKTFE